MHEPSQMHSNMLQLQNVMMQTGQGFCDLQHFSSVCWPAVVIHWDSSGEQVNSCTAVKSTFCENEQVFGFAAHY